MEPRSPGTVRTLIRTGVSLVRISVGYEIIYEHANPTPMLLTLHIHPSRAPDILVPDDLTIEPSLPVTSYYDKFDNRISRIVAPRGRIRLSTKAIVETLVGHKTDKQADFWEMLGDPRHSYADQVLKASSLKPVATFGRPDGGPDVTLYR